MNSTVCFLRSSPKYTEQLNKYCITWQALHYFIILYHKKHLKPFSIKEIYSQKKNASGNLIGFKQIKASKILLVHAETKHLRFSKAVNSNNDIV